MPLPPSLLPLHDLATNLWWSWDAQAASIWPAVDARRWERVRHEPVCMLRDVEPSRWAELAADEDFVALVNASHTRMQAYLGSTDTWCKNHCPELDGTTVAYLSMEFGLHESLRLYSGGLGVLAGDHLRSASDLGLPMVAVGMAYREGYFRQVMDCGRQVPCYPSADYTRSALRPVVDDHGERVRVRVPIGNHLAIAQAWRVDVGRVPLYLLDTDIDPNPSEIRDLTRHLYGGDPSTRIGQEILLGLGSIRLLHALGVSPDVVHLNEGHCAFAPLQMIAEQMAQGRSFDDGLASVRSKCVFTTHTPVPAGHDRFGWDLVESKLGPWRRALGLPDGSFMDLGRVAPGNWSETLCMTVLALRASTSANGVSKLHGEVSRTMWHDMWPDRSVDDVPIGHITNGVHPIFWMAPPARALFDDALPGWRDAVWEPERWAAVDQIPDAVLWKLRATLRKNLVSLIRERTGTAFDPHALTIGFARRFAPYKRGDLIFTDPDRLARLLDRGVQIAFSGKAHPQDRAGQEIIERVVQWAERRAFRDRVVFIEDYDMVIGRALTSGCDVWLNNPRRPREASGTSGQKVCLNGGLNLSVLDGWWPEGFDGTNGWALGEVRDWDDTATQDASDALSLYEVLENEVLPMWEERDSKGIPTRWLDTVRRCIQTCAPQFSSHRMVRDYARDLYAPRIANR